MALPPTFSNKPEEKDEAEIELRPKGEKAGHSLKKHKPAAGKLAPKGDHQSSKGVVKAGTVHTMAGHLAKSEGITHEEAHRRLHHTNKHRHYVGHSVHHACHSVHHARHR